MGCKFSPLHLCCIAALAVTLPLAVSAEPPRGMHDYGRRMEALFIRMDVNHDGRLDPTEVKGQTSLQRRLQRQDSRGYLLLEDLRAPGANPSGRRLQRRFHKADDNSDGRLSRLEAESIPWISRNFNSLDFNADGGVTLNELWTLQKALAPRHKRLHHYRR